VQHVALVFWFQLEVDVRPDCVRPAAGAAGPTAKVRMKLPTSHRVSRLLIRKLSSHKSLISKLLQHI
jgi:hypothetical protein